MIMDEDQILDDTEMEEGDMDVDDEDEEDYSDDEE